MLAQFCSVKTDLKNTKRATVLIAGECVTDPFATESIATSQ